MSGRKDMGDALTGPGYPAEPEPVPVSAASAAGIPIAGLVPVCTNRARPALANNHSKRHQWWAREVFHLETAGQHYSTGKHTLCGRDSTDWLTIDAEPDLTDRNLCARCLAKAGAA